VIVDLQALSNAERLSLLREAGDRLRHVLHPNVHPDRLNSQHFYEIRIKEDLLQRARRARVEKQRWLELREQERLGLRKRRYKSPVRKRAAVSAPKEAEAVTV
jgi:hypothetical protein